MQKLGQHFLKDNSVLEKIVNAIDLASNDVVIEVGPGHGELTDKILMGGKKIKLIIIERDKIFVEKLKEKYKTFKNVEILSGNALEILPSLIKNLENYKIVGNIPYYITGFLFRILGDTKNKPTLSIFTIQKEVAERIVAEPPKMNLLAASIGCWAKSEIVSIVSKSSFSPPPKVDSAIIKLVTRVGYKETPNYYEFIRALFKQPRKTISNNLSVYKKISKLDLENIFKENRLSGTLRPQNLKIEQIVKLSTVFSPKK